MEGIFSRDKALAEASAPKLKGGRKGARRAWPLVRGRRVGRVESIADCPVVELLRSSINHIAQKSDTEIHSARVENFELVGGVFVCKNVHHVHVVGACARWSPKVGEGEREISFMEKVPYVLACAGLPICKCSWIEVVEGLLCAYQELVELELDDVQLTAVVMHSEMACECLEMMDALLSVEMDAIVASIFCGTMDNISFHVAIKS